MSQETRGGNVQARSLGGGFKLFYHGIESSYKLEELCSKLLVVI